MLRHISRRATSSASAMQNLLRKGFQDHGHRIATVDPLNLWVREDRAGIPELQPETYGLEASAVDVSGLEKAYCQNLSLQASTCPLEEQNFLHQQFENLDPISNEELISACQQMLECQAFDHFLASKYPS